MADEKEREPVSLEDLVYSQMIQVEAITRLLVGKGIITKDEFYDEVKVVKAELQRVSERKD